MIAKEDRRFGAFILSHGRPELCSTTINSLDRGGYTGPWWLIVDSGDSTLDEYRERWGDDRILVFDKDDSHTDMGDNGGTQGVIIYARNIADHFAQQLGLTHYIQLDDDYPYFSHRWINENGTARQLSTSYLDEVFDAFLDLLETTGAKTVAMSQGGDWLGGADGRAAKSQYLRKAMNSFIFRTGDTVRFVGRINEDVNTYVTLGSRGVLFLTVTRFMLNQVSTQQQEGGMTGSYLDQGTFRKTFYTVMMAPSSVRPAILGPTNLRVHHEVNWNHAVPKILAPHWKK